MSLDSTLERKAVFKNFRRTKIYVFPSVWFLTKHSKSYTLLHVTKKRPILQSNYRYKNFKDYHNTFETVEHKITENGIS